MTEYFYPEQQVYIICTIEEKYSDNVYRIKFFDPKLNKFIIRAAFKKEIHENRKF